MDLSEDENIQKYAKRCKHRLRNTHRPYENEFACIACRYNFIQRKNERMEIRRKKNKF